MLTLSNGRMCDLSRNNSEPSYMSFLGPFLGSAVHNRRHHTVHDSPSPRSSIPRLETNEYEDCGCEMPSRSRESKPTDRKIRSPRRQTTQCQDGGSVEVSAPSGRGGLSSYFPALPGASLRSVAHVRHAGIGGVACEWRRYRLALPSVSFVSRLVGWIMGVLAFHGEGGQI